MNIIVLDTETINLEKQFVYDLGYTIADKESGLVIKKKSYIITQVWNNKPLMATRYYENKTSIYLDRLESGYSKKVSWGNAMRYLASDIKKYNVSEVYAYNSKFDKSAFEFMCSWFGAVNPLGTIKVLDIMWFIKGITETEEYKNFCVSNGYMTAHKTPRPQKKAETVYRFVKNDNDFIEEHTGLEDSLIELEILTIALGQ